MRVGELVHMDPEQWPHTTDDHGVLWVVTETTPRSGARFTIKAMATDFVKDIYLPHSAIYPYKKEEEDA